MGTFNTTISALSSGSGQTTQEFTLADIPNGVYNLTIEKDGHVDYVVNNVVVANVNLDLTLNPNADITDMELLSGDVNGNGYINFDDLKVVINSSNYNKNVTHSEYNLN